MELKVENERLRNIVKDCLIRSFIHELKNKLEINSDDDLLDMALLQLWDINTLNIKLQTHNLRRFD